MNRGMCWALVLGVAMVTLSGGRTWVRFTVQDPVLGEGLRTTSGYAASTALSAAALLGLAAALTGLLTRRRLRAVALAVLSVDALWATWIAAQVVRAPTEAVGRGVSQDLQSTTTGAVTVTAASSTAWVWVFAVGALLVAVAAAWLASRAARPRAPEGADPAATHDARGTSTHGAAKPLRGKETPLPSTEVQRRANTAAWNDLSRGDDPTNDV